MPSSDIHEHLFPYSFASLCLSYMNRYPSPLSPHIISSDLLSVRLSPNTGQLHVTKLVLKRGKLPRWAPRGLVSKAETFVLEECSVDVQGQVLSSQTRNLDHRTVLDITERYHFQGTQDLQTMGTVQGDITSSVGSGSTFSNLLRRRIEAFGLSSFNRNVTRSRNSLLLIHSLLHHPESPYRPNILDRSRHPALPSDLLEPKWADSLKRWQEVGEGFSGHGFRRDDDQTTAAAAAAGNNGNGATPPLATLRTRISNRIRHFLFSIWNR